MPRGPAKGEAYGVAYVAQVLNDVDFPISKQELIEQYGDEEIQWSEDQTYTLQECLEDVPQERFKSMTELKRAISEANE